MSLVGEDMPAHPFNTACATLSRFVAARTDPLGVTPAVPQLREAVVYLARRLGRSDLEASIRAGLDQRPPCISAAMTEDVRALLALAEASGGLDAGEQAALAKAAYMRSAQYDCEGAINCAFTALAVLLGGYAAWRAGTHGVTRTQVLEMLIWSPLLLAGLYRFFSRRKPGGILGRFMAYRIRHRDYGIRYGDWIRGRGRGADARPSRRQTLLLALNLFLIVVVGVLQKTG